MSILKMCGENKMKKVLVVMICVLGLMTTACDENEFNTGDLNSTIESLNASLDEAANNEEAEEALAEDAEEVASEEMTMEELIEIAEEVIVEENDIEEVVNEMDKEDIVEAVETIKDTMEQDEMVKTYSCSCKKKRQKMAKSKMKERSIASEKNKEKMDKKYVGKKKRRLYAKNKRQKVKKVMICHVPKGNPAAAKTLCLPQAALKAHIAGMKENSAMGYMGPCKEDM